MSAYVVVRRSVDWQNFSPADSIIFCRSMGLPETLVADFCALWAREMRTSYQEVRYELNAIAKRTWAAIPDATVISAQQLRAMPVADDDRVLFTDDDDWFSSVVTGTPADAVWGSVLISKFLFPPERAGQPVTQQRPFDGVIYTNNSSVSGATLKRLGLDRLFDHVPADRARRWLRYRPKRVREYLSCAVKHPCSTTCILYNMQSDIFRKDVRRVVELFVEQLDDPLGEDIAWIGGYRQDLRDIFRGAVRA